MEHNIKKISLNHISESIKIYLDVSSDKKGLLKVTTKVLCFVKFLADNDNDEKLYNELSNAAWVQITGDKKL